MKKVLLIFVLLSFSMTALPQGWVGNSSTNTLYPVNSSLSLTPLKIGIGLNSPTEQLHTNAGVRFEGITQNNALDRILASDATGKLFWRDASSIIPTGNFWSLTGNAGTNPGVGMGQNFLGTTNAQRLVFATNSTERMTILANGNVGIGITNPTIKFHATTNLGAMVFPYETGVFERGGDTKLGIYNSSAGALSFNSGGASIALGYSNSTTSTGLYSGYEMQYLALSSDNYILRFNALERNSAGAVTNPRSNEMVIHKGNVGIGLGPANNIPNTPTARFHVFCDRNYPVSTGKSNIRFEDLQYGSGTPLVIDEEGYVYISNNSFTSQPGQESEIARLKQELATLKKEIENIKNQLVTNTKSYGSGKIEVVPTPFSNVAKIKYSLNEINGNTILQITDSNGNVVKTTRLYQKDGQIDLTDLPESKGVLFFTIKNGNNVIVGTTSIKL